MPDLPPTFFFEQQQVLREIRDELRSQRMAPAAMGGGPSPIYSPRETGAMLRAQGMSDRMLLSDWNMLGWNQAYRPDIKSNLASDLFGAMGIYPPPNTMTSMEFRQFSAENISMRVGSAFRSVLAPRSTPIGNQIAQELWEMSPRFLRSGDPGAGILGTGTDRTVGRAFARQMEYTALGDMRLSYGDYSKTLSTGLQTGQFDFASSVREVSDQLRQMARVVGDVTRANRMTVDEVTRTMGALRQVGVTDFAEQGRIIRQIGSAARVAGVSNVEMAGVASAAIAAGLPLGLAPGMSAAMVGGDVAVMRELTRTGILDPRLMAAGGGSLNMAQSMTQARMGFLGSQAGLLAVRGGLGGAESNFFQAGMQALAGTGGTFQGMMRMQAGRFETMQGVNEQQADLMMRRMLQSQMQLMGIKDFTSQEAQDAAFMMTRGQMGDPAALAFAQTNFSRRGRISADATRFRIIADAQEREDQVAADRAVEAGTLGGATRRMGGAVGRWWADRVNAVESWASEGAEGYRLGLFVGPRAGGRLQDEIQRYAAGAPNTASTTAIAQYFSRNNQALGAQAKERQMTLYGQDPTWLDIGRLSWGVGGGIVGGLAGAGIGAALGSMIMPGIGTIAGGIIGGIAGGAGMGTLGNYQASRWFGHTATATISGGEVDVYRALVAGAERPDAVAAARAGGLISGSINPAQGGGSFSTKHLFTKWLDKLNLGQMSETKTKEFITDIQQLSRETGESTETINAAFKAAGVNFQVANAFGGKYTSNYEAPSENLRTLFAGQAAGGLTAALINGTSAEAVRNLALASTGQGNLARSLVGMRAAGFDAAAIDQMRENLKGKSSTDIAALAEELQGHVRGAAASVVDRQLRTAYGVAQEIISEAPESVTSKSAKTLLQGMRGREGQLIDILASETPETQPLRTMLRQNDVFRQALEISETKGLASMGVEDLTKRYAGLDPRAVQSLVEQRQAGGWDEETFKRMLMLQGLTPQAMESAGYDARAREASLLNNAAVVLDRAAERLGATVEKSNAKTKQ